MSVAIRDAGLDDLPALHALEADCLGPDAWSPELLQGSVEGTDLCLVAELAAKTGGALIGHAIASYAGDLADLQRIAVAAGHRRHGVATALLEEVVRRSVRSSADRLLLEVRADNHGAAAFYAAAGFEEVDRRPKYYRDGTAAVVLQRRLREEGTR